jgi:hypothetical protein
LVLVLLPVLREQFPILDSYAPKKDRDEQETTVQR